MSHERRALAQIVTLTAEVNEQRWLLERLARALHKHARTDLAPDAALPELARLIEDISDGEVRS